MLICGLRESCQTTIAPPAPSVVVFGRSWLLTAVESARPNVGHSAQAGIGASGTLMTIHVIADTADAMRM
jgi:hypothetical protein